MKLCSVLLAVAPAAASLLHARAPCPRSRSIFLDAKSDAAIRKLIAEDDDDEAATASAAASAAAAKNALSFRVRDALLDDEERPYLIWKEENRRPLAINLDLLNHRARTLVRRRDAAGAEETWARCVELDPLDGRAYLGLAKLRRGRGDDGGAEAALRDGLRALPRSAYLLQAYGQLLERRGLADDALQLYARALRSEPAHEASWVACSLLLQRRKQRAAAWQCLQFARAVAPSSYFVWQVIGQWHAREGEVAAARDAFKRSLRINVNNAATLHAWGVLEWRCANQELAAEVHPACARARAAPAGPPARPPARAPQD